MEYKFMRVQWLKTWIKLKTIYLKKNNFSVFFDRTLLFQGRINVI